MSPSCPLCGNPDSVCEIASPHGRYYCACGTVFDGTDSEWTHWARRRRERIERMAGKRHAMPVQQSWRPKPVLIQSPNGDEEQGDG